MASLFGLGFLVLCDLASLAQSTRIHKELFTTNAICRRKYCVNPIFPGVEDLNRLGDAKWVCAKRQKAAPSMNFCAGAVNYNPALPAPADGAGASLADLVKKQEQAAITMYAYHLAGMGLEYWDHTRPVDDDDDCVKSVWRMVCYTYFPRSQVGCQEGQETTYLKPCQSSCFNYIRTCGVECCDESVQCVFEHSKMLSSKVTIKTSGYAGHDGPSSVCTGGSKRSSGSNWLLLVILALGQFITSGARQGHTGSPPRGNGRREWKVSTLISFVVLALVALSMQGCDMDVPSHVVGNWRAEPDYLITYEFIPPEGSAKDAKLNSCSFERLAQTLQCSGRGICKAWDPDNLANPISFCECDVAWADPECRTPRRSQMYAYILSLFFGLFGVDQFYLGFPVVGAAKLATLGGFGMWWLTDIIRIGSAPVYAHDFRTSADLPHWAFVLSSVTYSFVLGFTIVGCSTLRHRRRKRKDAMLMQAEEEARGQGDIPSYSSAMHSNMKGQGPGNPRPIHSFPPGGMGFGGPPQMHPETPMHMGSA